MKIFLVHTPAAYKYSNLVTATIVIKASKPSYQYFANLDYDDAAKLDVHAFLLDGVHPLPVPVLNWQENIDISRKITHIIKQLGLPYL